MTGEIRNRILILFAHPALQKSKINIELIKAVKGLDGVTFRDLYEEYPDFLSDVEREQELLLGHDIIVLQHPFYWYSCPAIIKEWEDLVLEYGFAYGYDGTALKGKMMMPAVTAGGSVDTYDKGGINYYCVRDFLKPFEQTAELCGMHYLPPFVEHGTHHIKKADGIAVYKEL